MLRTTILTIYVVGTFFTVQGQYWEPLGGGVKGYGNIWALQTDTFHDLLFVGGTFDSIGTIEAHDLAVWNGSEYKRLSFEPGGIVDITMKDDTVLLLSGIVAAAYADTEAVKVYPFFGGTGSCIYVYNDTVLVGGNFLTGVIFFNGTDWETFHGGVGGQFAEVNAMTTYNGELIVAGHFNDAGGVDANNIAAWDGSQWHALGEGVTGTLPFVEALEIFHDDLYAGGSFTDADGAYMGTLVKWDGLKWDTVILSNLGIACGEVRAIYNDGSNLFMAGGIVGSNDCPGDRVAAFDGSSWYNLHLSYSGFGLAISVYDHELVVGTDFDYTSTSDTVNYLGRYIGIPVGSDEQTHHEETTIFPNPASATIHLVLPSTSTTITIFNLLGEKVREEKVMGGNITMDVSELRAGLYLARSSDGLIGKFLKE